MRNDVVRLFQTLPHACGYFSERVARNLVIDPAAPMLEMLYQRALARGYRRSGGHVYLPNCEHCQACVPVRVAVADFVPDRSQRRCLSANRDIVVDVTAAGFSDERFALYQRYLHSRHLDGGMDDPSPDEFERFLSTDWSPTRFVEFRIDGALVAVAATDVGADNVSAVYTWFDPALPKRGLGTFAVLSQIELARHSGLDFVYLGYWIAGHPKMHYKSRFQPLEMFTAGRWRPHPGRDATA